VTSLLQPLLETEWEHVPGLAVVLAEHPVVAGPRLARLEPHFGLGLAERERAGVGLGARGFARPTVLVRAMRLPNDRRRGRRWRGRLRTAVAG
jgi:hypothetical protein